jgi:Uma2 family endonuclease
MIDAPVRVQFAEYERFIALPENQDRRFELIDGEIVEKTMPTQEHGITGANIVGELYVWWTGNGKKGWLMIETRVKPPADDANDRIPNISYIAPERADPVRRKGSVPTIPDLVIEILSPDDSLPKTRAKMKYYMENGARLGWLVIPAKKLVEVYRADGDVIILTAADNDVLDGETVLPAFSVALSKIFV